MGSYLIEVVMPDDETPRPRLTHAEASAMTVNERLFVAGLLPAFDEAVTAGDEDSLRAILAEVFLRGSDADAVIRSVLGRGLSG